MFFHHSTNGYLSILSVVGSYSLDDVKPKKRTQYKRSELRLVESQENVCDRVLTYSLHKERKDSTRFAKGMPQTFQTLHGLVNKGVKVDLGIPMELWDNPPVEVTQMKSQCESLLESNEHHIEDWYFKHQDTVPLIRYLCEERALKGTNTKCLYESFDDKVSEDDEDGMAYNWKDDEDKMAKNWKGDKDEF